MKTTSQRLRAGALALPALMALVSCGGGGGGGDTPPPVSVAVTPGTATVKIDQTQQFTAAVSNTGNTAVDWTLSGAGCTGVACGRISAAGLYTAPSIVPVPPDVTVKATARADTTRSATAAITLASDVALEVWPKDARLAVGTSRQFVRLLTGSANENVTWGVTGAACTGAACGSVSGDGMYVAPVAVPGNGIVTLRATSVVDRGKSATTDITVLANNNAKLNGGYVFFQRGWRSDFYAAQAGAFVALGDGSIGSGTLDSITAPALGGNRIARAFTGGYALGDDNRGAFQADYSAGGSEEFAIVLTASGTRAFIQPFTFGNLLVRGNGELYKQVPGASGNAAISGDYVFQLDGWTSGGMRYADLGRFTADGAGAITAGLVDSTDGTRSTENVPLTGSYSVSQNGRATMQLTIGGVTYHFAAYVVSADHLVLISTDEITAGPLRVGRALRRTGGTYSNASLQGNYVFTLTGDRNKAPVATTGLLASDGAGAFTGQLDRNDNYTFSPGLSFSGTYVITPDGRGLLTSAAMPRLIFRVTGRGEILMMEQPGPVIGLQTGQMLRQVAAPYSTAHLLGQFASGSTPPLRATALTVTGQNFYDGRGAVSSVIAISSPCTQQSGPASATISVSPAGRIDVRDPAGAQHAGGYLISPVEYFMTLERPSADPICDDVVHNYTAQQ